MAQVRQLLSRLRNAVRPFEAEPDLTRELNAHLRLMQDDFERQGLTPEQARIAARKRFGGIELTKNRHRDARSFVWLDGLWRDAVHALKAARRDPAFAMLGVAMMALGIGTTTTLFSVAYGVLMKPLPWPDADHIMRVVETRGGREARLGGTIGNGVYFAWRDRPATIDAIGGYAVGVNTMTALRGSAEPVRLRVTAMTPSAFLVLRAQPLRGRFFTDDEVAAAGASAFDASRPVVISHALWQDWFGGQDAALGSVIRLDDVPHTIVGVMASSFAFPDVETRAWTPMPIPQVAPTELPNARRLMIFGGLARLKPGVTPQQAAAEGTVRARQAPDPGFAAVGMFGSNAPSAIRVTRWAQAMTAEVRPAVVLLLAAAVLLLATAVANLGGLQLARASTRRREMAVRAALGAGRTALVRQLFAENTIISVAGAIGGIAIAFGLARALLSILPGDFPRAHEVAINAPVLAFAVVLSMAASIGASLMAATLARGLDLASALADEGVRSSASAWRPRAGRLRAAVMTAQVGVATLLLIDAALLSRSFVALVHADRGYDPANLLTARDALPRRYNGPALVAFSEAVLARIRAVPGVTAAATANALPLLNLGETWGSSMPSPSNPGIKQQVQANFRIVSPDYFRTMRLRLVEGRVLADSDGLEAPPVVVVDRTFARNYLGDVQIGVRLPLNFGDGRPEPVIVGVVGDMHQGEVTEPQTPEVFMSVRQLGNWMKRSGGSLIFLIRAAADPISHVATLRTAVHEQDPSVALDSIMTMEERVATSLAKPRLYAWMLSGFAIAALAIAGGGLFGVLSFSVAQRTREIGIRSALGAQARDIVSLLLRQATSIVTIGVAIGLAAASASVRLISVFLYGVTPHDMLTLIAVPVFVALTATIACVIPARRAANVDPLSAIRIG